MNACHIESSLYFKGDLLYESTALHTTIQIQFRCFRVSIVDTLGHVIEACDMMSIRTDAIVAHLTAGSKKTAIWVRLVRGATENCWPGDP